MKKEWIHRLTYVVLSIVVLTEGSRSVRAAESQKKAHQVARELVEVTGNEAVMDQVLSEILAQFASDPEKQAFVEIFKEEWDKGEPTEFAIAAYVKYLTVEEMQAVIKFYRSPAGRKFIEKQPLMVQELMAAGQVLGQQVMGRALMRIRQLPIAQADPQTPLGNLRHQLAQAETAREMRRVGNAMMQWLTDQLENDATTWPPDGSKPMPQWHVTHTDGSQAVFRVLSYKTMTKLLVPTYIDAVPKEDGWGHPYQFAINDNLLDANVLGMRSPGQDGVFETGYHKDVSFAYKDYHQDIVWGDGYFLKRPEGIPQ